MDPSSKALPKRYIALYDIVGRENNELSFKKNDIIEISPKDAVQSPGWLFGSVEGKQGIFPEKYIKEVEYGKALYNYPGSSARELSVKSGDIVLISNR